MIYYVNHIKDTIGNYYLGIDIPVEAIKPFLEELKIILGDKYDEYDYDEVMSRKFGFLTKLHKLLGDKYDTKETRYVGFEWIDK